MKITLQEILPGAGAVTDSTMHLYYHASERLAESEDGGFFLKEEKIYDFSAYYNLLSVQKRMKYCDINNISLELEISGSFYIELMGYYTDENGKVHRESVGRYLHKKKKKRTVTIAWPEAYLSTRKPACIAFKLEGGEESIFYGGRYFTETYEKSLKKPHICIVTALKEQAEAAAANIRELSDDLFTDTAYKDAFDWIIYNAGDIKDKKSADKHITFESKKQSASDLTQLCRDVLKSNKAATHALIMSPDINVKSASLKRLYNMLRLLKDDYEDSLFEAAMFSRKAPGLQAVDCGRTRLCNDRLWDIRESNQNNTEMAVRNEAEIFSEAFDVLGWWLCCVPKAVLSEKDTLPFPGSDDSVDKKPSKPDVITLNGFNYLHDDYPENVMGADDILAEEAKLPESPDNRMELQDILLGIGADATGNLHMFYRPGEPAEEDVRGFLSFAKDRYYDFSTYFNSFSFGKWKEYTVFERVWLELDMSGEFRLELMGHYMDKSGIFQKEWLGKYDFDLSSKKTITVEFPTDTKCDVFAFQIKAKSEDVKLFGGRYLTYIDPKLKKQPFITLATTTFKKEKYMEKNIRLLKDELFSDDFYKDKFNWFIIDNGRTLDKEAIDDDNITVISNPNVGGSGGFTRGIIEANTQKKKASHVILMDDDVEFFVESFKRVYKLLSLLKDEYSDHFISGAMLEMEMRNVQHEDIGHTTPDGEHGPVKPRWDLNSWDCVIHNEQPVEDDPSNYAGWWFCCIPLTIARLDNLPLPVFIRGDDVEYSVRNKAKFITMNGICIWHQGFGNKFSAYMEFYQVHRNDLIWKAMNPHVKGVNVLKRIKDLFWQEIYKFNYKGAELLLDAVEDYLKGPDFITNLDGEKCMKEKKEKDNVVYPLTPVIEAMFSRDHLYEDVPLAGPKKMLYDYSYNGQMIPVKTGNKTAVIPYGWGYWPGRQFMADTIYAVDMIFNTYAVFRKNRQRFKELTARYNAIFKDYNNRGRDIAKAYRAAARSYKKIEFWNEYLENQDRMKQS